MTFDSHLRVLVVQITASERIVFKTAVPASGDGVNASVNVSTPCLGPNAAARDPPHPE
jgi:hypothetical protein